MLALYYLDLARISSFLRTTNAELYPVYLLNEIYCVLQVHAKVYEFPLDAFLLVLFLFQNEHVMVEKLLQTLVGVVDQELFQCVHLKSKENCVSFEKIKPYTDGEGKSASSIPRDLDKF